MIYFNVVGMERADFYYLRIYQRSKLNMVKPWNFVQVYEHNSEG